VTRRLVPESIRTHPPFDVLDSFGAAPIVSVDIWLDRRVVHETMIGLRDETMEWVFDKGRIFGRDGAPQHLSLLISAAHEATARPNADLVAAAEHALRRYFPSMSGVRIERSLVLREPEATFASRPQLEALRPKATTPIAGLFLAGDWTATGLPATIEGAVRSGFEASRRVCDWASAVNTTKGRTTWSDERSA
jgi:predicted NAD/FAD-dependent oxidoreductase